MSELEQKASEAWVLLSRVPSVMDQLCGREPMPIGAALDFVQNVDGDRDNAVFALLDAASKYLQEKMPKHEEDNFHFEDEAFRLLGDLRGEFFGHAHSAAGTISFRAQDMAASTLAGMFRNTPLPPSVTVLDNWRQWAQEAIRIITLCSQIAAEAYPV